MPRPGNRNELGEAAGESDSGLHNDVTLMTASDFVLHILCFSNMVPWWSQEIKQALAQCNKAPNRFRKTKQADNLILHKKLKARARSLIRFAKKHSWNDFVSGINRPLSCSLMWSNSRKLANSNHNPSIHHPTHQNQTFHTPSEISECLADHYSSISSNFNYETDFLAFKAQEEKIPISFTNSIDLSVPYNHPISLTEVQSTIHAYSKKSAPGPDEVLSLIHI